MLHLPPFCLDSIVVRMAAASEEVKLVNTWVSPFGLRVKLALEVKGVKYEEMLEDLANKTELLLRSNPIHKKVPILIHNGRPLCESRVIVEYIDEVWPSSHNLLPEDPYERALARFWADFVDNKFVPAALGMSLKGGEEQEKAKEETIESIKTMEKSCGALNPFFGGEHPGYIDIILAPFALLRVSQRIFNFDFSHDFPRFFAWMKAVDEHPVLGKCLPDAQKLVEHLFEVRKMRLQT